MKPIKKKMKPVIKDLTVAVTIIIIISSLAIMRVKEETKGSGNQMASKSVLGVIDPRDSREC